VKERAIVAGTRVREVARGAGTVKETDPGFASVGLVRVTWDVAPATDCNGGFDPELAVADHLAPEDRAFEPDAEPDEQDRECPRCRGLGTEMDDCTPCRTCGGDGYAWWR
jgi:hypothetical protein